MRLKNEKVLPLYTYINIRGSNLNNKNKYISKTIIIHK